MRPVLRSNDVQPQLSLGVFVQSFDERIARILGLRLAYPHQACIDPFKDMFEDAIIVFPVQQQMRCVGEEGPLLLARQPVVQAADTTKVQDIIPSACHSEDGYVHTFGSVDGTSRELKKTE